MSNVQQTTAIYDETAAQINAAFQGFQSVYSVQTPPPVLQIENRRLFTPKNAGLFGALVGSIIVSASHTIPVFLGVQSIADVTFSIELLIAVAAFVMIEIGIVTFAYSATESAASRDEVQRVRMFTTGGKWFVAFIMLIANVFYVLQINVIPADAGGVWSVVRVVIYLSIGASAPVIAFITGDILAIDVLKHRSRQTKAQEQYNADMAEWRQGLNDAWSRNKRSWGGNVDIQVSTPKKTQTDTPQLSSTVSSNQTDTRQTGYGYTRVSSAVDAATEWLTANPDKMDLSVRELSELIGVGKDSVAKAKRNMQK